MPDVTLPASLPAGASITKTRHLPGDVAQVSFSLVAEPGSDVLAALLVNAPFPPRRIDLAEVGIALDGERPLTLDGGRGAVTFGVGASADHGMAIVDEPADVIAMLVRDGIGDRIADGLDLERKVGSRYALLRWGYDFRAAARGSVGLGIGATATFGAEARRAGAYVVVREIAADAGALTVVRGLVQSWMLPSQVQQLDDLDPGTWIVTEVDGSVALTLGAQYGYDLNWVREAVSLGSLSGDIGLKIEAGVTTTFGFEASGQYAVAVGRSPAGRRLRLQIFRLDRKGVNLAFSAAATMQGGVGGLLPDRFDEFVEGVFGMHLLQVLKDLEHWTLPESDLADLLAGVGLDYATDFLGRATGIDPRTSFDEARARVVSLLQAWHALPHEVAASVESFVQREASSLPVLRAQLTKLANQDLDAFRPEIDALLAQVDFFRTPLGRWLEAAALGPVLSTVSDTTEYARVQQVATRTLAVLDGAAVEATLVGVQREVAARLGLDTIERIVDQASFDRADEWLKARLSAFLGRSLDLPAALEIRVAVGRLLALRETFFAQARSALTKKYEFELIAAYQRATTKTALVDVVFDFDAPGASSSQLTRLLRAAIDGDFEQVLVQDLAGVTLRQGVLTHGITRQTHLDVTLPFLHADLVHLNSSLVKTEAIQAERGRVLVYDLAADDLVTARGRFSSRLAVHARFARDGAVRVFDERSMTHSYVFRQAVPRMRRRALEAQLAPYVRMYFPSTFGGGDASLGTWISDLDRTVDALLDNGPDNFGNTLLSLELSAPAQLVGAWALAPPDEKAEPYFTMSHAIQAQLKTLIPLCHFADPAAYRDRIPSAALLVYAAMPPAHGIVVDAGRIVDFDDRRDIYWDIDRQGHVEALARHSLTVAALHGRLATVHDTLIGAGGMADVAADYHPRRVDRVLANALATDVGREDLRNLLVVERMVVRDARAAGLKIAGFLRADRPERARAELAAYGARVTDAFNSTIGGLFSAGVLRPLGTLVFLEAARSFSPDLESERPSAILELTILKEQTAFDMASFVTGAEAPRAEVVRSEKFVAVK